MKTILITGSNGLLGQKLIHLFVNEKGWNVVATSFSPDKIQGTGYQFELMDVSSPVEVEYIFNKYKPDAVINTAAMTQVDICEDRPGECHRINTEAVGILAKACKGLDAQLVHLSSDFVFSGRKGRYTESDPAEPVSIYGASKAEAEKLLMKQKIRWSIVRTSLVYGVNPDTARPNLVLWLRHALSEKQEVKVNNDQFRTPTLAEDLAWGCLEIVKGAHEGIFHLAGPEYLAVKDVALKVAEIFELDATLINEVSSAELAEKGARPLRAGLDISKAYGHLGYRPHKLAEGIAILKQQLNEPRFSLDI